MANTFKSAIGNSQDWDEVSKAVELPELEDSNVVANIFEEVCQPLMKNKPDKNEALLIICKIRTEVLRTTKDMLSLEALETQICNLEAWSELNSDNSSEADYLLAVHPIINILLRSEKSFTSRSGEVTPSVIKHVRKYIKKIFNVDFTTTTFGRKIDVMVFGNKSKVPLSAKEWKKQNVDKTKLLLQQAKNIRVNKCYLSHMLEMKLTESEKKQMVVTGMDCRGLNGYMFGVKKVNHIYSSVLIDALKIICFANGEIRWQSRHLKERKKENNQGDKLAIGDKVDLRICTKTNKGKVVGLACIEFARNSRDDKFYSDHRKLLREGKTIVGHFYGLYNLKSREKKAIAGCYIQIGGVEGQIVVIRYNNRSKENTIRTL